MMVSVNPPSLQVFDIGGAAERLPNRAPFRAIGKAIRRRVEAGSALLDLKSASHKVAMLARLVGRESAIVETEFQDDERASIGGSLFQHALLLYARVATSNDQRGAMPLTNGWTDEQRAKHRHLLDLRRKVVAHFGYGDHYADGTWAMDRLLLVQLADGQFTQVDYGQRTNYKQNDAKLLSDMLPLALSSIERIKVERDTDLDQLLTSLPPADFAVFAKALGNPIDGVENLPAELFASLGTPPRDLFHTLSPAKEPPSFGMIDQRPPAADASSG
ncbi:hypothetical protein NKJ87_07345 [Mesorhizobium sp. M0027]|uniref:hypothetical protein n=1 Tax=unclassified Mesorhizobium TaxID=325217 RepID=UPI0003CE7764|nr:hypothetical protein [Mesorhizobium sp. LSHC420B00]ESX82517.1 hypothetical protein X759_06180 [Mesorhizobium sp. LSHC420B00]